MTTHLAKHARVFDGRVYAAAWCVGPPTREPMVFEAALSDCDACLAARSEALHQVAPTRCGHQIAYPHEQPLVHKCVRAPGHAAKHTDGDAEW